MTPPMTDFPELERLRESVLAFADSRDLASFWDLVCSNSRTLIPSRRVCAILLSDFDLLYLQAAREGDRAADNLVREFSPGEGEFYEAMKSGRPAWLRDASAKARMSNALEDWLLKDNPPLLLLLPVSDREQVIGSVIFAMDTVEETQRARLESAGELYALHVGTMYSLLSVKAGLEVANRVAGMRNDELKESRSRLSEMNHELQEADRLKQEFLANMSHELRTPLNSIIGFSDLLSRNRDGNFTEKNLNQLEKINRNGKYLLQMINNLLDITLLQAGEVRFETREFYLREVLDETMELMRPVAAQRDIAFNYEGAGDQLITKYDPDRLKQILTTLISNAVKFVDAGTGRVDLIAEKTPGGPRIIIGDNGMGISEDKIRVIMEPFRQADGSSTRDHGGLGLGLTIARKLMEAMGGELQVESREGHGSRFTLIL